MGYAILINMANKLEKFARFFKNKYFEWEQNQDGGVQGITRFAEWLGVDQPLVSSWMKGAYKPSEKNVKLLARKLGPEVYDALDLPRPDPDLERLIKEYETATPAQKKEIIRQVLRITGFQPEK